MLYLNILFALLFLFAAQEIVEGVGGATGVALVEIYEEPEWV